MINPVDLKGPVDPFIDINLAYHQEPAPMGVADYGIGPGGPYSYATNSSMGSVNVVSLSTQNSSGYPVMSMQLNVNLKFSEGGRQFVYWVQDVADVDTSSNSIIFVDNIWNSSAPSAAMSDVGVKGSGTVAQFGSSYFYYEVAGTSLPGNNIDLAYPTTVEFRVNSSVDASKQPRVTFEYNDGYGWQEYDSVTFTAVHQLTSMSGFVVDGFTYNPVNFYDSELIIGGAGGGSATTDTKSDLRLQLEYWNGHNYQLVTNAYNFGSDTAEAMQSVVSRFDHYPENGEVIAEVQSGAGTLGKLWDQSGVGMADLKSSVASGTLEVRNSSNLAGTPGRYAFKNGEVTVALYPGSYELDLYSGTSLVTSGKYALAAGQLLNLVAPLGTVPFTLSYAVVGGGSGYSPPTLTYRFNGTVRTTLLGTTPTVFDLDSGSAWSISSELPGSSGTQRWETGRATNGSAASGQSESITYYHQYLETVSYSVSGGGSGYSAPALSGQEFGAAVSFPLGTLPASYWLDGGTAYSATNPLPGSTSGERWFTPGGHGSVSAPGSVVFAFDHQFYLTVTGGVAASAWYDSGAQATVGQPVTFGRTAGTGQRVVAYSVDGAPQITVAPVQGNVTVAMAMNASHTVSFVSLTQYQVTLQAVPPQELDSITPPTIGGDSYWYDSGSAVSLTLFGVWDRSAGEGQRLVSYSVNGEAQVQVDSRGTVEVLAQSAISSPNVVIGNSTVQFFLTATTGAMASITQPPISGDAGWYDNKTTVTATYEYSWNASAGETRLNALSYSVDGVQTSALSRRGSGTFGVSLTMGAPHTIEVMPTMQYLFTVSGGFNVTLSLQSPTGDGFYDSGSNSTVTSSYVGGTVIDEQRQALFGYTLDAIPTSISRNETGAFTTPLIFFDTHHSLVFESVVQYFVGFEFTDSSGSRQVVPTSLSIERQGGVAEAASGFSKWVDNGSTFTIASVIWEGADVKPLNATSYRVDATENITVKSRIYPASVKVNDLLGLAVQGVPVSAKLANGTTSTRVTDSNGVATFGLIPVGTYQATISNLGSSSSTSADASVKSEAATTVALSFPVLGVLLGVAALVVGAFFVRRRGSARIAPSMTP